MEKTKRLIKFVCISDTHTKHDKLVLPKGDVLIHAGDFSYGGAKRELIKFTKFLEKAEFEHKIVIAGNHEITFDKNVVDNDPYWKFIKEDTKDYLNTEESKKMIMNSCTYLENSGIELYGYKIWGSPVTPTFYNWAFMKDRGEDIKKVWDQIPEDTDILLTHGPPHKILDFTEAGEYAGCEELKIQVLERVKPLYHIFGHIHEANGIKKIDNTTFINAAICDFKYKPTNPYYTFELEERI
jgi:Icc-related predicted phosphoesterase